jgi:hypothetical protein
MTEMYGSSLTEWEKKTLQEQLYWLHKLTKQTEVNTSSSSSSSSSTSSSSICGLF